MKLNKLTFALILGMVLNIIMLVLSIQTLCYAIAYTPTSITTYIMNRDALVTDVLVVIILTFSLYVITEITYDKLTTKPKIKSNLDWTPNIMKVKDNKSLPKVTNQFSSDYLKFITNVDATSLSLDIIGIITKTIEIKPVHNESETLAKYYFDIWAWYNSSSDLFKRFVDILNVYNWEHNNSLYNTNEHLDAIPMDAQVYMSSKSVDDVRNMVKPVDKREYPMTPDESFNRNDK